MSESLWRSQVPPRPPRASLAGELEADVAIVGGGFTGLWTAYWLLRADPAIQVAIVEAETVGFGASGRNGGWCSALFPVGRDRVARQYGRTAARAMQDALIANLDTIEEVITAEGIDCGFHRGGTLTLARSAVQVRRAEAEVADWRDWGYTHSDFDWLPAAAARERLNASGVHGATFTPHCARLQPLALVQGLAQAVERRGAVIYEQSSVTEIATGEVRTAAGRVRARHIIDATEAWRAGGRHRGRAPVYSLMVATAPLSDEQWQDIGLADGGTFADYRHLIIYGQRTADGRIAFGGRGAPYHFRSSIRPGFEDNPRIHRAIREVLLELLPQLAGVEFTHAWGGPLAIPRDWFPSVQYDPATGRGAAGGYVGDGVAASALAGRTLADLVRGVASELTRLPWAGHRSPDWEVEPFRWLGVNAGLRVMTIADAEERVTGRESLFAAGFNRFIGK